MPSGLGARLADALRRERAAGGGFGPQAGQAAEPEPTAVGVLALDDDDGRRWLIEHQRADGRFTVVPGPVQTISATALAALALDTRPERPQARVEAARDRAVGVLPRLQARRAAPDPLVPQDPTTRGWGWTLDTAAWVEPTAWAVLALRRLRPGAATIADGLRTLADRECVGGGWNYGNRIVYDVDLVPFVQTTAAALLALQGVEPQLVDRGRRFLLARWRDEATGLSLALALAALRLTGDAPVDEIETALAASFDTTGFLGNTLTTAWAALATGPGLDRLRIPS
jgi:hypothetical protein